MHTSQSISAIMPPRINLFNQALAYRPRTAGVTQSFRMQPSLYRKYASDPSRDLPAAEKGADGPNMQQQEHVSEEAAKMAKITGGSGPDMEAGTPVQEVGISFFQTGKLCHCERYIRLTTATASRRRQGSSEVRPSGAQGQH